MCRRSKLRHPPDPLGREARAGYDGAGRQTWQRGADGRLLEMGYDASGRLASLGVDGVVFSAIERDLAARTVTIQDRTDPDRSVRHQLEWDRNDRNDGAAVVARAREVMVAVVPLSAEEVESESASPSRLPAWFVQACAPAQSEEDRARWLAWWRALPPLNAPGQIGRCDGSCQIGWRG